MSDILDDKKASSATRIVGDDEEYAADVVLEKGIKKLWVKATVAPQILGNLLFQYVTRIGQPLVDNMKVLGTLGAPVIFEYKNNTANDLLVNDLQFEGECVSPSAGGFLGQAAALTNGVIVEVRSEGVTFQFRPIRKNYEFDSLFAKGIGSSFLIYQGTGNDYVGAKFSPANPFFIRRVGSLPSDDYIRVIIRDDLSGSGVVSLKMLVFGAFDV